MDHSDPPAGPPTPSPAPSPLAEGEVPAASEQPVEDPASESPPHTPNAEPGRNASEVGPSPPDAPKPIHETRRPRHPRGKPPHSPFRTLANVSVIFICVFLFVRVVAVEPFGVPTGSMAPALLGNHREGPCPRCGFPVRVGAPTGGNAQEHYARATCPNCGKRVSLAEAQDVNGDRLLVDKNIFNLRPPRRWEMAVFHCPDTDPKEYRKPYVKRVVGLPGETMFIVDGDVYADGELLRKSLPELRETRVLLFDMSFVPGNGWNQRWLISPPENDPRLPAQSDRPALPAGDAVVHGGTLTLDAGLAQSTTDATYRNWNIDAKKAEPIRVWNSYDGPVRTFGDLPAAHNFSVEFYIEVASATGGASFACGLNDGADWVRGEVSVGPRRTGHVALGVNGKEPLASARGVALEPGRSYRIEFSFVSRRVILAIDGKVVASAVDLPAAPKREAVELPLHLRARGCRLVVTNVKLYRDTYYTQYGEHGTQRPVTLPAGEYFMLGDNSGNSQDARKWPTPGVPEAEFIGKPFLIHQPLRPARITIGGTERIYQTVDWSRLRWLH